MSSGSEYIPSSESDLNSEEYFDDLQVTSEDDSTAENSPPPGEFDAEYERELKYEEDNEIWIQAAETHDHNEYEKAQFEFNQNHAIFNSQCDSVLQNIGEKLTPTELADIIVDLAVHYLNDVPDSLADQASKVFPGPFCDDEREQWVAYVLDGITQGLDPQEEMLGDASDVAGDILSRPMPDADYVPSDFADDDDCEDE